MKTIPLRRHRLKQITPVFRTPETISDLVYQTFNSLAHRAKLIDGTSVFASRLIREESFTKEELLELKAIINGDEETAELSAEILGAEETLRWIEGILKGEIEPYGWSGSRR